MLHDEANGVIVRSTLELAHALGLSVVAEGVEDEETYQALRDEGCDVVQGFFLARPMSASALLAALAEIPERVRRRPECRPYPARADAAGRS
jgi:EAL domain-containing protein (putative c-di-GMP-specific phosphodiesterase class I)